MKTIKKLSVLFFVLALLLSSCTWADAVAWATGSNNTSAPSNPSSGTDGSCGTPVDGIIAFDHPLNMDVGDPSMYSSVYASEKSGSAEPFVAVVGPMSNLDFEAPQIVGNYQHFTSLNDAACTAKAIAMKLGVKNLIFVGTGAAPDGFDKYVQDNTTISGWILNDATPYSGEKIDVPGAVWKTVDLPMADKHNLIAKSNVLVGQFWGTNSKMVDHFVVDKGYTLTTTNDHGTYWIVSGSYDRVTLFSRITQMDSEVQNRDHPITMTLSYCGEGTPPTGYSTSLPNGWVCSKN